MTIDAADLAELVRGLAGLAGGGPFRVVVEAGGRRVELAAGPAADRPFIADEADVTSTDRAAAGVANLSACKQAGRSPFSIRERPAGPVMEKNMSMRPGLEGSSLSHVSDDLSAAADAACFLAIMVAEVRKDEGKGFRVTAEALYSNLNARCDEKELAIRAVMEELKEARGLEPVRFGGVSAATAHQVALEMLLALWEERLPDSNKQIVVNGKPVGLFDGWVHRWETWPDAYEVMAAIRLEEAQARKARRESGRKAAEVRLRRAAAAEAAPDGPGAPPDVQLPQPQRDVLLYLLERHPRLELQEDISAGCGKKGRPGWSRQTVGKALRRLRAAGLVHRPGGVRQGDGLTDEGIKQAQRLRQTARRG